MSEKEKIIEKANKMKCWDCEKEFDFMSTDYTMMNEEYYDEDEQLIESVWFVKCPHCNREQEAEYDY